MPRVVARTLVPLGVAATLNGPAPAGGFGYAGMTTDTQGVALPADPAAGTVWFTFDGGKTWAPYRVS